MMKKSLKDKLHQPYRAELIKGFTELTQLLENKDDILGAACISFIITYAFIKPLTHRLKIKSWLKFVLYFICYVFLLLLISLA